MKIKNQYFGEKMSKTEKKTEKFKKENRKFIDYLYSLHQNENRAVLSALKKGIQFEPGECVDMYPYVLPWIKNRENEWYGNVYFIIAALFAMFPTEPGEGNIGDTFYNLLEKRKEKTSESLVNRFAAMLRCHRDDLYIQLRQIISLISSEKIPIDWNQLFMDLKYWDSSKRPPYRQWANSFWKYKKDELEE
jgi:CRISPR system Cascade subunit CasB